jgi:hypothetical protein
MKKLVASLFFILVSFSFTAQTPIDLKLNLDKGKVYTAKSTSKQTMQQSVSGQSYNIEVNTNRVLSYRVLSQANDILDIEWKFDTISSKVVAPMMTQETNSTKPGKEPTERIMNKMSIYPLQARIKTSGKFIEFINYGQYKDNVMMVIDSLPDSKKDAGRKQAEVLLRESAVRSMVEPFFSYLPEKSLNMGDTWETSFVTTANDMSYLVFNTYSLKGVENNLATISGTSEIESMPSSDPNAAMTQSIKGTATVEGRVDLNTGLMSVSTEKSHMEGSMTVNNAGSEIKVELKVDSQSETIMSN